LKRLKPHNTLDVKEMMYDSAVEIKVGLGGEWIAKVVNVGDNVVVCANNSTNESF
jgi:hypothetical protein